jgi:hypothetical protein
MGAKCSKNLILIPRIITPKKTLIIRNNNCFPINCEKSKILLSDSLYVDE